jgi:hypothetical protein
MGNVPVLTPTEVIAILLRRGFTEVRQTLARINNFAMLPVAAPPCRFIKLETSHRSCSVKSPKTLASRLMSCSNTDSPTRQSTRTLRDKTAQLR